MAYSEELADRVRKVISSRADITEKKMFGGIAFMVNGNMCIGVNGEELMVRIGKENHDEYIKLPGARIMDFTNRPMKGYLFVGGVGIETDGDIAEWVQRCLDFVMTLPAK